MTRFSSPVRLSSTDTYWPGQPDVSRRRVGSPIASTPSTTTSPASALSSVVSMRTTVVLPAPLGPSRPSTVPGVTSKSTPSTARTSP